jgi:hypothetical protein
MYWKSDFVWYISILFWVLLCCLIKFLVIKSGSLLDETWKNCKIITHNTKAFFNFSLEKQHSKITHRRKRKSIKKRRKMLRENLYETDTHATSTNQPTIKIDSTVIKEASPTAILPTSPTSTISLLSNSTTVLLTDKDNFNDTISTHAMEIDSRLIIEHSTTVTSSTSAMSLITNCKIPMWDYSAPHNTYTFKSSPDVIVDDILGYPYQYKCWLREVYPSQILFAGEKNQYVVCRLYGGRDEFVRSRMGYWVFDLSESTRDKLAYIECCKSESDLYALNHILPLHKASLDTAWPHITVLLNISLSTVMVQFFDETIWQFSYEPESYSHLYDGTMSSDGMSLAVCYCVDMAESPQIIIWNIKSLVAKHNLYRRESFISFYLGLTSDEALYAHTSASIAAVYQSHDMCRYIASFI